MRERWKRLVAMLGVAVLVAGQNGGVLVRADELPAAEEDVVLVSEEGTEAESTSQEETTKENTETVTTEEATVSEEETTEEVIEESTVSEEETTEEVTEEVTVSEEETTEEVTEEETGVEEDTTEELTEEGTVEEETTEEMTTEEFTEDYGIALLAEEAGDEVQVVNNLRWSDEKPGEVIFYNPNEENVSFIMQWYKDGEQMGTWSTSRTGAGDVTLPVYGDIFESGTYTFKVETFAYGVEQDYDMSSGYVSELSPEFNYTRPSAQVGIPQNISWSSDGVVFWDPVENSSYYWSFLYYTSEDDASSYKGGSGLGSSSLSSSYADEMASGYNYYVRVRAVSDDITKYANGELSDYIGFDGTTVSAGVNAKLDETIGDVTAENAETTVNAVKDAFADDTAKGELQIAMQTDTETQEKIQNLENVYQEAMGLSTSVKPSEDTGIDASSVKLLGAALNATEKGGSVTFNMTKPDEETQKDLITNSRFKKAIVLDLELEGAGITKGENLAIPVTVTMAAPAGIDVSVLTILHYNEDGTYETLPVRKNSDGTISFTVTHFSNFVFGEKEAEESGNNSGSSSSSSKKSSSSSSSVSVPSWKPTTPDEVKRYAVMGKEKVEYVADAANAYPVIITNAMQGKLCFDSFEAVLGDYTIGRTYNIYPSKNTVYKMDSAAKITLAIPKALQTDDREYKMICVTEKGLAIVLDDLDMNPETITFETDSYYAFALIYKDAVVLE